MRVAKANVKMQAQLRRYLSYFQVKHQQPVNYKPP
ncbi:hypothetical protein ACVW2L_004548 [Mucilaginibacter sp. HD30]